MTIIVDGGAGITFPDTVQQTNGMTNTGGNPKYYAARAWVNFNGTGTVAIRASVGVSSITDVSTGQYRVNFSVNMPDTRYATFPVCSSLVRGSSTVAAQILESGTYSTSATSIIVQDSNGSSFDPETACVAFFR